MVWIYLKIETFPSYSRRMRKTFSVRNFHLENLVRYLEIKFMRLWQHILRLDYLGVFKSHTCLPWASSKLSIIVCFITPVLALEVVYAPGLLFRYSLDYNLRQLFAYDLSSLDLREIVDFHFNQASFFFVRMGMMVSKVLTCQSRNQNCNFYITSHWILHQILYYLVFWKRQNF